MNNIADFAVYKKKFNPEVVYVGDAVEWLDYDGRSYFGKIIAIKHCPIFEIDFVDGVDCFPMWEKKEYTIVFENGFNVSGEAILRKVVKEKNLKLSTPLDNFVM